MLKFDTFEKVNGMQPARKKALAHAIQVAVEFEVHTKEGIHTGKPGDFLMCGIHGELYVCDQEIFNKSYEWVGIGEPEPKPEPPPVPKQDWVRVLRVIEYVGERDLVERQVNNSLHGTKILSNGNLSFSAATVGVYPEVLVAARDRLVEGFWEKAVPVAVPQKGD